MLSTFFLWRCTTISDLMINEQIRDREVRLIGADGSQLGIMSSREAMRLAEEAGLDLVKIAPTAKPPVCKITANSSMSRSGRKRKRGRSSGRLRLRKSASPPILTPTT